MNEDYTQRQTVGEQMRAEELSLRATIPPAEVPGYRLERLLGQGAFGQVWVGKNLNTGRSVAVKFYLHRGGVDWSLLSREVKHLVSMAANRFIVQVLEVGWEAEPPYYVMEFLENGSLDDLIRNKGVLAPKHAAELFSDIALGLNHSHGKGVLHCDLKPANVLLDQDLRPRLADFGQSRMSDEQTPSLGTLFYMAPEQADLNALPDARWDVYALGAIVYCMVVGTPPHRSPQMVSTLDTAANLPERLQRYREAIQAAPTPRLHHRIRGMDRELASVIDVCLAYRPEDRFANVQQVLEALDQRRVKHARRPLMLLGIVGPMLLLLVMTFFAWDQLREVRDNTSERLRKWSMRSNEFAAKFAARSLEVEISGIFQLLSDESTRTDFRQTLDDAMTASQAQRDQLRLTKPDPDVRREFIAIDEVVRLQRYLDNRLKRLTSGRSGASATSRFSSLFVLDPHGTNLGIALQDKFEASPQGLNFAYRTYFHGLPEERPPDIDPTSLTPTAYPHITAPFRSTSTGRWKIAICTPIYDNEEQMGETSLVRGIVVLTINIGEFELLSQDLREDRDEEEQDSTQANELTRHAVLVGTSQNQTGQILQHPYILQEEEQRSGKLTPIEIDSEQFSELKKDGKYDYHDPVSRLPHGQDFEGDWVGRDATRRFCIRSFGSSRTDPFADRSLGHRARTGRSRDRAGYGFGLEPRQRVDYHLDDAHRDHRHLVAIRAPRFPFAGYRSRSR